MVRNATVRILALVLACMFAMLVCTSIAEEEQPFVEIDIFRICHPSAPLDDIPEGGFPVDNFIEEKFNCKLNVRYVPGANGQEIYNSMMASGEYNTLVQNGYDNLDKYRDAWAVLNDYIIGKYENLEKHFFNDPIIYAQSANDAGEIRILSSLYSQYMGSTLMVRGDIVEKYDIDLSDVNTKEEWHDLFVFIQENEPDMIPYCTRSFRAGFVNNLCEGWSGMIEEFYVDGDTVKFGALQDDFYEVLEWCRDLYAEGLIDQQYPTTETSRWQEAVLGNGVFLTHDNASSRIDWADAQWASMGITDRNYRAVAPLQPEKGVIGYTTQHYPSFQDSWGIKVGTDEVIIDRLMQIFDYCLSDEGFAVSNWGVEGVYYELDDRGAPIFVERYSSAYSGNRGITLCFPRLVYNTLVHTTNPRVAEAIDMYEKGGLIKQNYIQAIRFTDAQQEIINTYLTDIKTYKDETLDGFIMGTKELTPESFDAFRAKLVDMGIEYVLDVYQEAFQTIYDLMNP